MKYLIPLGAVGVLYIADNAGVHTTWATLVTMTTCVTFILSLLMAIGGNKKHGR